LENKERLLTAFPALTTRMSSLTAKTVINRRVHSR
jgi:hypothetical protein